MKNEVILTGKTVEEAMAQARAQYGTPENELSFEILEMPKKGFFGIGAAPAKIKVTITKALEDVNLSDLVSELRNMKLTTDRDGTDVSERTERPQKQPKPQQQKQEQKTNAPAQKQPNPSKSQPQKAQADPAQKPQNPPKQEPKAAPAKQEAKPAAPAKPEAMPAAPAKPEAKPAAPAKPEAKPTAPAKPEAKPELNENDLPAALRRPVKKADAPQKKQPPKKQSRPADDRDGETKKKDLLSAVMGVADAPKKADSPAVTVTPTVMKPKSTEETVTETPAEPVRTEEKTVTASTTVDVDTAGSSLSAAVDAALAAIEAETPAPLEIEEEEETAAPAREEKRVEFVTPAEMELALQFVNTLLADMNLDAKAEADEAREGEEGPEGTVVARIKITGSDTGILIGHHGETLDAIQYLMNLSTSRRSGSGKREFVKILLDIGNYREKREETLRALARRTAARVVKYKRNIVLEPMNPYERRIIHSEIHDIADVSTHSVGSDENRKIVITYEGADKPKDGGKGRRDRRRGERTDKADKADKTEKSEKTERSEKSEKGAKSDRPARSRRDRGERPAKPVRAKSIDEIQIDLSGDSDKTFGSIGADEGVETDDPIEAIAREAESTEESLREY